MSCIFSARQAKVKTSVIAAQALDAVRVDVGSVPRLERENIMSKLEEVLPEELKKNAIAAGNELVLSHAEALSAIRVATEHQIAVLGLEAFAVRKDGLLTVAISDPATYIHLSCDWSAYVAAINAECDLWVRQHAFGDGHGYILTSASEDEFADSIRKIQ